MTPEELVKLAGSTGLTAIALTDHDCTTGVERLMAASNAAGNGFIGIPGVEISADVARGTMHILGYFLDPSDRDLEEVLVQIRDGRQLRNKKILVRLNELGLDLTWEEVAAFAGEDVVGRPHFAQALEARGYVKSKKQAFDRYLAKGKPGYVDRFRLQSADCISVITRAGGVAVLAHPFTLDLAGPALRDLVRDLKDAGLAGLETYYSEYSPQQEKEYRKLAAELGLLEAGGSDFHGAINPGIRLGAGFGSLNVPDELVGKLKEAASGASRV
ncbi:phosphoesterase [Verrucomicrobiota bacterium]